MTRKLVVYVLLLTNLAGLISCANPNPNRPETSSSSSQNISQSGIKTAASSSGVHLLQTIKTGYESSSPQRLIAAVEPGQSESVIAGVKQGVIDIGAISRPLKSEERSDILESREIAHDALLVATHPTVTGVKNLSSDDLKAIYSGQMTNWQDLGGPNAKIVVLDRPEDESAKRLLRKHHLGQDLPNAADAVVLLKEGDLIQAVQNTPYSIGTFSLAYAVSHDLKVTHLSLNGIAPTVANLKSGQYPMKRSIVLVWRKNALASIQDFLVHTTQVSTITSLEKAGFAVISSSISTSVAPAK